MACYATIASGQSLAAVHAHVKDGGDPIAFKTYVSANLNEQDRPPLQLSLSRDSHNSNSVALTQMLTQVLTFDRPQFNVLDDRDPHVRNTAAWTLRMGNNTTNSSSATAEEDSNTLQHPGQQLPHTFL